MRRRADRRGLRRKAAAVTVVALFLPGCFSSCDEPPQGQGPSGAHSNVEVKRLPEAPGRTITLRPDLLARHGFHDGGLGDGGQIPAAAPASPATGAPGNEADSAHVDGRRTPDAMPKGEH